MTGQSPVNLFDSADETMHTAMKQAQRTFKFCWRELSWEYRRIIPGLDVCCAKTSFACDTSDPNAPSHEHMWVNELDFDGTTVHGVLANSPNWIPSLSAGERVSIPLDHLMDWMFAMNGECYGGFTIQAIRSKMQPDERRQHDAAWGLRFGDPNQVKVAQGLKEPQQGWLGRVLGRPAPAPDLDELSSIEHPMSLNMEEKIREGLTAHPEMAMEVDEEGWTMLHRDALAGNATPVRILLEFGADRSARTPSGLTARDLAASMGWPLVESLLA